MDFCGSERSEVRGQRGSGGAFGKTPLTWTIPGSAATFPICFMAGRKPPTPATETQGPSTPGPEREPRPGEGSTSPTGVPQLLEHQLLQRVVHVEVPLHLEQTQIRLSPRLWALLRYVDRVPAFAGRKRGR